MNILSTIKNILFVTVAVLLSSCAPIIAQQTVSNLSQVSYKHVISAAGDDSGMIYAAWIDGSYVRFSKAKMGLRLGTPTSPITATIGGINPKIGLASLNGPVYLAFAGEESGVKGVYFSRSINSGSTFEASKNLSTINDHHRGTFVAASGSNVNVAWIRESRYPDPSFDSIYVASSTDRGQNFSAPIDLSGQIDFGSEVKVGVYQNNVYVLWCQPNTATGRGILKLSRSTNSGASFSSPIQVTASAYLCGNMDFMVNQDNLYITWVDGSLSTNNDLYFRASHDKGATFTAVQNISNKNKRATHAKLAASGSNVYLVWVQRGDASSGIGTVENINFSRSTNNGASFSSAIKIPGSSPTHDSTLPDISVNGGYIHIAWSEPDAYGQSYDTYYTRSSDNGSTFKPSSQLPPGPSTSIGDLDVKLASRGISVYALWVRSIAGSSTSEVYYYSKRACPVWPSETSSYRCTSCCK